MNRTIIVRSSVGEGNIRGKEWREKEEEEEEEMKEGDVNPIHNPCCSNSLSNHATTPSTSIARPRR